MILYTTLCSYSPQIISLSLTWANLLSTGQQENNGGHWEWFQEISFQLNRSVQNETSLGCPNSLLVQPAGRTSSTCRELFVKGFRAVSRSLMQEAKAESEGRPALFGRQAPPVCWWWLHSAAEPCVHFVYCHWRWQRSDAAFVSCLLS